MEQTWGKMFTLVWFVLTLDCVVVLADKLKCFVSRILLVLLFSCFEFLFMLFYARWLVKRFLLVGGVFFCVF